MAMSLDIFAACEHGDVNAVRTLLDQNPSLIGAVDEANRTALARALQAGHVPIVHELLARHADPRVAQTIAVPNEHNQQAFALVREAALHADTRMANQFTPQASTPAPGADDEGAAQAHLPPPEVARMIPCKFFPYCRYGDRCVFQHPSGPVLPPPEGMVLPPGAPPVFFPGPGIPFPPGPGPYGVPPPFAEMNRPMFPVQYGPSGVPFYVPPVQGTPEQAPDAPAPEAEAEKPASDAQPASSDAPSDVAAAAAPRPARPIKKGHQKAGRTDAHGQRTRAANGSRPSCTFFARSACRYASECRFPHVLPDGSDARQLPSDDKDAAPRAGSNHTQDRVMSDNETPSSGSSTPQTKKPTQRRANQTQTQRVKNGRRGSSTPAATHRKAPQQRVPNSDEFPALPGGCVAEPAKPAAKGKAHFSAILSAPAPPKQASRPAPEPASTSEPTAPTPARIPEPMEASAPAHVPSRDFSVVAATHGHAVTV
ncbi:hypothetical protein MCAP1_002661 [Malassezia caprae]|uniref:C3H1-type domain-containing protein n=1 Tax=Malassezia caprae TaxID=1381934 RepID=A0AAF0ED94_9BASI|nr:hypothetical protein MCAP1_002661 [Malassezia caprae]